jgi:hypothetical protein
MQIFKALVNAAKQTAIENGVPSIVDQLDVRSSQFMSAPLRCEIEVDPKNWTA